MHARHMNRSERKAWGPVILAARLAAGIKQEELEEQTGVTRQTISAIEQGRTVGQEAKIALLVEALGLSLPAKAPDVDAFLVTLRPLLVRLTEEERAEVMVQVVDIVANVLVTSGQSNVSALRSRVTAPGVDLDYDEPVAADDTPGMDDEAEAINTP